MSKPMKVLLSTSGSGGHTVPIKWVSQAVKLLNKDVELFFIGAKNDKTNKVLDDEFKHGNMHLINTGKYRRYASQSRMQKIVDWQTNCKNITDLFKFVTGLRSAYRLLKKIRPDIILIKGGSVALPVGLAANYLKIPLLTHDSDTIPGISNKIAGKKAKLNLVASEKGNYPYTKSNIRVVGVPVNNEIKPATQAQQKKAKKDIGFSPDKPLLLVSGGSLGAVSINNAITEISQQLESDGIQVLHQCGERHYKQYQQLNNEMRHIKDFMAPSDMTQAFAAMDLLLARGSATLTHEASAAKKPMIMVPAKQLYDQISNAQNLSASSAVIMLSDNELEQDPQLLYRAIIELINNPAKAAELAAELHKLYNPRSDIEIAEYILGIKK